MKIKMATDRKGTRKRKTNKIAENQLAPEHMPIKVTLTVNPFGTDLH